MKRPTIVHFIAIKQNDSVAINATLTLKEFDYDLFKGYPTFTPRLPLQSFVLMRSLTFQIKLEGVDQNGDILFAKNLDTDRLGVLEIKIPLGKEIVSKFSAIRVYETKYSDGIELCLGSFIPLTIVTPKKVLICDFDKTLVDTKYSTAKEMYESLTNPLEHFPTVQKSVDLVRQLINEGLHPFILSASPHFYEDSIRDWLYQNNIYSAGIFLKDYRKILAVLERELTPKDIKMQGLYKLNHLLDIIFLTGIPDHLVLIGDNFESDPLIYQTFAKFLLGEIGARSLWVELQRSRPFLINRRQKITVLNKLYHLSSMVKISKVRPKIDVYIRMRFTGDKMILDNVDKIRNLSFFTY